MSLLVTGAAGFIGSNLIRHFRESGVTHDLVALDLLTYAGRRDNLPPNDAAFTFVLGDICDGDLLTEVFRVHDVSHVIHLAAESHVDRSICDPLQFVKTNVLGTATLLNVARKVWGNRTDVRFHHVSTDEVYGSLGPTGHFVETTSYDPSSPYSASKAGSDHLVRAWGRTYGLPITISNCSNNYGPHQVPEKLVPLVLAKGLAFEPVPVYGTGLNVRDWLYVDDHCRAIDQILHEGVAGETYNVGGRSERTNLEVVGALLDLLDELEPANIQRRSLIQFVRDRPGHDQRYAIDCSKLETNLKWTPLESFETGLRKTVEWYLAHRDRLKSLPRLG